MKTTNYKASRIFVVMTLLVVLIDTIYALVFHFIDYHAEGTIVLAIFYFPLLFLGYFLWIGRKFAAILLAVLLIAHGLVYLLGTGLSGSVLILMLAVLNMVAAVSSILSVFGKFQKSGKK